MVETWYIIVGTIKLGLTLKHSSVFNTPHSYDGIDLCYRCMLTILKLHFHPEWGYLVASSSSGMQQITVNGAVLESWKSDIQNGINIYLANFTEELGGSNEIRTAKIIHKCQSNM